MECADDATAEGVLAVFVPVLVLALVAVPAFAAPLVAPGVTVPVTAEGELSEGVAEVQRGVIKLGAREAAAGVGTHTNATAARGDALGAGQRVG